MSRDDADTVALLTAVLLEENAALAALDLSRAVRVVGRKAAAIAALEAARKRGLAAGRDELAALREAALANASLLERAIRVQRRVVATVVRATSRHDAAPRYRADAGFARARRATPVALHARV